MINNRDNLRNIGIKKIPTRDRMGGIIMPKVADEITKTCYRMLIQPHETELVNEFIHLLQATQDNYRIVFIEQHLDNFIKHNLGIDGIEVVMLSKSYQNSLEGYGIGHHNRFVEYKDYCKDAPYFVGFKITSKLREQYPDEVTTRNPVIIEHPITIRQHTEDRAIHQGDIVRHFKGNLYEIMDFAIHTETGEKMVVYKSLYKDENEQHQVFVRPYDMFIEKVDKDKYPQATQEYRMEKVEVVKV